MLIFILFEDEDHFILPGDKTWIQKTGAKIHTHRAWIFKHRIGFLKGLEWSFKAGIKLFIRSEKSLIQ